MSAEFCNPRLRDDLLASNSHKETVQPTASGFVSEEVEQQYLDYHSSEPEEYDDRDLI